MQTFNQSLALLVGKKQISADLALAISSNADELRDMFSRGVSGVPAATAGAAGRPGSARRS
jgi:hypothetical protein